LPASHNVPWAASLRNPPPSARCTVTSRLMAIPERRSAAPLLGDALTASESMRKIGRRGGLPPSATCVIGVVCTGVRAN
jgi:hypothetical protein